MTKSFTMRNNYFTIAMMALFLMAPASLMARTTNPVPEPTENVQQRGVRFWMHGSIGGTEYAIMEMNGMTGSFEYAGIKRKLKFSSYDRKTGKLILSEYDLKGKYIGQFVGTYQPLKGTYKGTFTNTKGGKTNFELWYGD